VSTNRAYRAGYPIGNGSVSELHQRQIGSHRGKLHTQEAESMMRRRIIRLDSELQKGACLKGGNYSLVPKSAQSAIHGAQKLKSYA
jgi:hypothetical protein